MRPITFPVVGGASFGYGWMDCRDECTRFHKGTDVMAVKLQPLVSPVDGVVERFLRHPTAGVGIVIRGDDGYQYRLYHLNNDTPGTDNGQAGPEWSFGDGLAPGVRVLAGELVGFVGDSGNAEDYLAHVHVEIWRPDGMPINPYWSLQAAERGGLQCAPADDIDDEWLRVVGVSVSPAGFRPDDDSLCAPDESELDVSLQAVAAPGAQSVPLSSTSTAAAGGGRPVRPGVEGPLEQLTVTLTVDAGASVDVTNLTAAAKQTTVVLDVSASAAGPGVGAVEATAADPQTATLDAGGSSGFTLDAAGAGQQVITDPAVLAGFVGTGTVTFDVTGLFGVDVQGPATWRGQGSAEATATVVVEYNADGTGGPTTTPPPTTPPTTPPPTTTAPDVPPVAVDDTCRRWPRTLRRRRSTCWPTTPTPTAARSPSTR